MSVRVGAIIAAVSFSSLAVIPSRPVDLLVLRVDSCLKTDATSISLNSNVELNCAS
jgi:hypothetical protein